MYPFTVTLILIPDLSYPLDHGRFFKFIVVSDLSDHGLTTTTIENLQLASINLDFSNLPRL